MQNNKEILKYSLEEYINKLNSEFIPIIDGSFARKDTGELFTSQEVKQYINKKLELYNIHSQEELKRIENDNGFYIEQNIYNSSSKNKKKRFNSRPKEKYDGGEFNMVYRDKIPKLNEMLNFSEKGVWYSLCELASYPSNCALIDGEVPTYKQIADYIGMSERNLRRYIKTFEEDGLIKSDTVGFRKALFINPQYYVTGKELDLKTLKLFGLVVCDENKVNNYI